MHKIFSLTLALTLTTTLSAAPPASTPARGARGGRGAPAAPMIPMTESAAAPMLRVNEAWADSHMKLVDRAKHGPIDLYLLGDSITENWLLQFKTSYDKYFSAWKTGDFGVGGDRTEHALWRIQNGEMEGLSPKVVVLQIGTNNLYLHHQYTGSSPAETAAGIKAVVDHLRKTQPQAKILLVSVFPRDGAGDVANNMNPKIKELNALIARLADNTTIKYLDLYEKFLDKDGKLLPGLMQGDNIHPAAAGYELWGQAMTPILTEWLGGAAR